MTAIPDPRPVVLALHGFTLGGEMFTELGKLLDAELVAPDLPGHGGRGAEATDWSAAVAEVGDHISGTEPDLVVGYSMGGRLALAAALAAPGDFAMVLVSAAVGIADTAARRNRVFADELLASQIETGSVEEFVARWERTELLSGHDELNELRRRNTRAGLAAALRGLGQGTQPYLGDQLSGLRNHVVWMAGQLDTKYVTIATEAAQRSGSSRVVVVPGARHNVIADAPAAVGSVVTETLASRRTA